MLGELIHHLWQRGNWIVMILFLLAAAIFLIPIPISTEQIVSDKWCSVLPYPFLTWTFADNGEFTQQSIIIDSVGAGSSYSDSGVWNESGRSFKVVIYDSDLLKGGQEIVIRPAGFGKFLWAYGDLLGEIQSNSTKGVFIWQPCSSRYSE